MVTDIIRGTPAWVWLVLLLILWRGYGLTEPQLTSRNRLLLLPAIFIGLSFAGANSTFGLGAVTACMWGLGVAVTAFGWGLLPPPAGAEFRPDRRAYHIPGSWLPLLLIVCAFCVRYGIGIALAMHAEWRYSSRVAALCAFVFGAIAGLFLGRACNIIFGVQGGVQGRWRRSWN